MKHKAFMLLYFSLMLKKLPSFILKSYFLVYYFNSVVVSYVYICIYMRLCVCKLGFPGGSDGKESVRNAEDLGSMARSGRSPGEGNDNSFQYSCLENSMDIGAWRATVHEVAKSRT